MCIRDRSHKWLYFLTWHSKLSWFFGLFSIPKHRIHLLLISSTLLPAFTNVMPIYLKTPRFFVVRISTVMLVYSIPITSCSVFEASAYFQQYSICWGSKIFIEFWNNWVSIQYHHTLIINIYCLRGSWHSLRTRFHKFVFSRFNYIFCI